MTRAARASQCGVAAIAQYLLVSFAIGCQRDPPERVQGQTPAARLALADEIDEPRVPADAIDDAMRKRWSERRISLTEKKCETVRPQDFSERWVQCALSFTAKRCTKADWCWIDCVEHGMGVGVGGGCSHICFHRDYPSHLWDDFIAACPL